LNTINNVVKYLNLNCCGVKINLMFRENPAMQLMTRLWP